jgi:hypothetical protein
VDLLQLANDIFSNVITDFEGNETVAIDDLTVSELFFLLDILRLTFFPCNIMEKFILKNSQTKLKAVMRTSTREALQNLSAVDFSPESEESATDE